jgi:hypothetical protein
MRHWNKTSPIARTCITDHRTTTTSSMLVPIDCRSATPIYIYTYIYMNPSRTHNFHDLKPLLNTYACRITFCFYSFQKRAVNSSVKHDLKTMKLICYSNEWLCKPIGLKVDRILNRLRYKSFFNFRCLFCHPMGKPLQFRYNKKCDKCFS